MFFTGAGDGMTLGVRRSVSSGLVTMLSLDASSRDVSESWVLNCRKEKKFNNKYTSLSINVIVSGVGRSINELIYLSPYCSSNNNYHYCFVLLIFLVYYDCNTDSIDAGRIFIIVIPIVIIYCKYIVNTLFINITINILTFPNSWLQL